MTSAPSLGAIARETRDAARITFATVDRIAQITRQMNVLGLNARIEAARVGQQGAGFALVAEEVRKVSGEIGEIASELGETLKARLSRLEQMVEGLSDDATGTRLVDLAFSAIDVMDRNLYERSCDVRWWATDADLVRAATSGAAGDAAQASARLGVILDAYTVYSDIWLVGFDGRILCNGRPRAHRVAGRDVSREPWFGLALQVADGGDFVAGDVAQSDLLGGGATMAWATPVRAEGQAKGRPKGVLVTQFDWGPQAAAVLDGLRFGEAAEQMQAYLTDQTGRILAARGGPALRRDRIALPADQAAGWLHLEGRTLGFHRTEGFETWGGKSWYGVVELMR